MSHRAHVDLGRGWQSLDLGFLGVGEALRDAVDFSLELEAAACAALASGFRPVDLFYVWDLAFLYFLAAQVFVMLLEVPFW